MRITERNANVILNARSDRIRLAYVSFKQVDKLLYISQMTRINILSSKHLCINSTNTFLRKTRVISTQDIFNIILKHFLVVETGNYEIKTKIFYAKIRENRSSVLNLGMGWMSICHWLQINKKALQYKYKYISGSVYSNSIRHNGLATLEGFPKSKHYNCMYFSCMYCLLISIIS